MDGSPRAALAVAARRGVLGMTQQELADKASVDAKTIGNLESRGVWPIARTRARIENALGWPPGELQRLRMEEETPPISRAAQAEIRREIGEEGLRAVMEFLRERQQDR